jgi:hypothetical protein
MAEQKFPYLPKGRMHAHAIDPGPFALDLYRLICMVLADRQVAKHGITSRPALELRISYLFPEVTRILISSATALRIGFDQRPKRFAIERSDCGKLFPSWATDQKKVQVLGLREACNKIIHATDVRFDAVIPDAAVNPDEEGSYLRPYVYLYGTKDREDWRAVLSVLDFAQWGTTALMRWG